MSDDETKTEHPADDGERNEFEVVKQRLEEIADAVGDESLSLDEALDLYEEAVSLGLQASDLLEVDIDPDEAPEEADDASPDARHTVPNTGGAAAVTAPAR